MTSKCPFGDCRIYWRLSNRFWKKNSYKTPQILYLWRLILMTRKSCTMPWRCEKELLYLNVNWFNNKLLNLDTSFSIYRGLFYLLKEITIASAVMIISFKVITSKNLLNHFTCFYLRLGRAWALMKMCWQRFFVQEVTR